MKTIPIEDALTELQSIFNEDAPVDRHGVLWHKGEIKERIDDLEQYIKDEGMDVGFVSYEEWLTMKGLS